VDRLNQFQDNQKRREEDQEILNWLTSINYTLQHNDFVSQRRKGTGYWLVESTAFQEWLETSTGTLFTLGMPGVGKTILASIVVDELLKRYSDDDTIGIAYIYCNFRRTHEQKVTDLLVSLLKQLAHRRPTLPDSVGKMYKRHQRYQTRPLFNEISTALQSVSTLYSRVFVVVDALDECQASGGCRSRLLKAIFDLQEKSKAKVFATSRNVPEISEKFRKRRSLEIEIYAHDVDVHRYLDGNMFQMQDSVGCNPELELGLPSRRGECVSSLSVFDIKH
jgi:Cdc6-like AAA superfamily ATPase